LLGVIAAILIARSTLRNRALIEGADTCAVYRTQVIEMHDRGMEPTTIRAILALEHGNVGDAADGRLLIELNCGRIDDIVSHVPRRRPEPPTN
jgi:hypothetical protein